MVGVRKLRTTLTIATLAAGTVYLAYRLLLSDEAKESIKSGARTVNDAVERMCKLIDDAQGSVMEEDVLPNRQRTEQQWDALGF